MILDYSTSRPSMFQLKAAGVTAVGRYIGWDSVPGFSSMGKNITKTEAAALRAAGIAVFLAFEYAANAAAKGTIQGSADGKLAHSQLSELGSPPDMCVYFAVDFDIPDYAPSLPDTPANALTKLGPVGHYFQAINALKLPYRVGVYGGYWAVKRVLDANLAVFAWQAIAWSGGHVEPDPRCVLFQNLDRPPLGGADVDVRLHEATSKDFGQWSRSSVVKSPVVDVSSTKESEMPSGLITSDPFIRESHTWASSSVHQIVMFSDWEGVQDKPPVVDLRIAHLNSDVFDAGKQTVDGTSIYTIGTPSDCNGCSFTRLDSGPATVSFHTN